MIVASEVAIASKTATHLESHRRWDHACMSESAIEPPALGPGEGRAVRNPVGGILTFKLTADQSAGAVTAIDTVAAPGEGPPLHVHRDEDEIVTYADLPEHERGAEAFARLANETQALEVLGPPLAQSDPI
jgi:hypothetical protein